MPESSSQAPSNVAAQDLGPSLRTLFIFMIILPTILVTIRFWSRALLSDPNAEGRITAKFWWDDWSCLLGWVLSVVTDALGIQMVNSGLGRHISTLELEQVTEILKLLFVASITFDIGTAVAKSCALFFYARIFSNSNRTFTYALWLGHALNTGWLVSNLFLIIFECRPIAKAWKPALDGECISVAHVWLGSVIPGVIIDLYILILPLPMLCKLQMKLARKILTISVFICGYAVIIVSLGRLITISEYGADFNKDFSYTTGIPLYWLGSEIPVSVTCVSLPTAYTLVIRGYRDGPGSLLGSIGKRGTSPGRGSPIQPKADSSFKRLYSGPEGDYRVAATSNTSSTSLYRQETGDISGEGIYVKREFEVN